MTMIAYPDHAALAAGVAAEVARDLRAALQAGGEVTLALPGGTTPGPALAALAREALDWGWVVVMPGDERRVPQDHPRSNAGLIARTLLVGAAAGARLRPLAEGPLAAPDVVLLGMGEDGHIASLFPGAEGLEAALDPCAAPEVVAMRAPDGEARLSLNLAALRGAGAMHLMITGAAKRAVLEGARDPLAHPVAAVKDRLIVHWAE